MPKRLIKITAWFSLLTYLLAFMVGGVVVVCYGEDGHVAIEITLIESCCSQTFDSSSLPAFQNPTRNTRLMSAGSCGSCVDVPVSMNMADHRLNTRRNSSFQTQGVPLVYLANHPTPFTDFTLKSLIPPIRVVNDATILSLQTIVLLI